MVPSLIEWQEIAKSLGLTISQECIALDNQGEMSEAWTSSGIIYFNKELIYNPITGYNVFRPKLNCVSTESLLANQ